MTVLIDLEPERAHALRKHLLTGMATHPIHLTGESYDPARIHYLITWQPAPDTFSALAHLKVILSYGAGVDALLQHSHLPDDVPIVRFVDPDLSTRMSDYIVAEVTRHHRLDSHYRQAQSKRDWTEVFPRRADEISVGIMGLGALGRDAAEKLLALGFRLRGWSRGEKTIANIECYAGPDGFEAFLSGTDILVNLLPLTAETAGCLNRTLFSRLRKGMLHGGPAIINAARGGHLNESDLIAALGDGTLGAASLDVFTAEPLPKSSPLWDTPNCYLTPHIAAVSSIAALARYFAEVIKTHEAGQPLPNLVDRDKGY